jgi:hypothetical protein
MAGTIAVAAALVGCRGGGAASSGAEAGTTTGDVCGVGAVRTDAGCVCPTSSGTKCGNSCSNLGDDADNCGACGHACPPTSACIRGACGPETKVVVPPALRFKCYGVSVAVSDGTLYWTDLLRGTVQAVRLDGSEPLTLASGENSVDHLVVRGSTLFWSVAVLDAPDPSDGGIVPPPSAAIRKLALGGSAAVDLVADPSEIKGLALSADGATLYYSAGLEVKAVAVTGGAPVTVARDDRGLRPGAVALEGSTLAWAATDLGRAEVDLGRLADGVVATCGAPDPTMTAELAGAVNCARVAQSPGTLNSRAIVLRDGRAFWSDGPAVFFGPTVPSPFPSGRLVAFAVDRTGISAIAGGPDALYFAESDAIETVAYASGAVATKLARSNNSDTTGSIAVDGRNLYWVNADCAIVTAGPF